MFDRLKSNLKEDGHRIQRTAAVFALAGSAAVAGCGNVHIKPQRQQINPPSTTTTPKKSIGANCKGFSFVTEPGVLQPPIETTLTGPSSYVYFAENQVGSMAIIQTSQPDRLHVAPNQYIHSVFMFPTDKIHTATFQEPNLVVTITEHGQNSPSDHSVVVDFSACPKSQV